MTSRPEITGSKCLTMGVVEAGRLYLGLGRNASYQAAENGQLPVIRVGGRLRVPIRAMEAMLDAAAAKAKARA